MPKLNFASSETFEDCIDLANGANDGELYDFLSARYAREQSLLTGLFKGELFKAFDMPEPLYRRLIGLIEKKMASSETVTRGRHFQKLLNDLGRS